MRAETASPVGFLRVLADETRLRVLGLLAETELSVGELARALAMGQSRVSNHLKVLRESQLIVERHEGSFTYCRMSTLEGSAAQVVGALKPALETLPDRQADRRRLASVLADRADSRAFFDRIAGDWDLIGSDFALGTGRLEVLGCLVTPDLVVADVGCGTGYLARALGRRVRRVICVDTSSAMLEKARDNLADLDAEFEFRTGAVEALPLQTAEVDAACAHMVLHHLSDTRAGLAEMARVTRPGGLVVAVELLPHREDWMREAMADARLGLDPVQLEAELRSIGLIDVHREILGDSYVVEHPSGRRIELPLFLIRGRRAAAASTAHLPS
ncbi:MAG: ArsR/SmtB family transcription factor [Planctomycetota bacterium]